MQFKVFSIRDAKAEIFHTPFYKATDRDAERDFKHAVNDKQTKLNEYPEDFDLYCLGTYEDRDGKFQSLPTLVHVVKGIQVYVIPTPPTKPDFGPVVIPNTVPMM